MDQCTKVLDTHLQTVLDIWGDKAEQSICSISGNCMAPLIREGDLLVIKHGNQDIHIGDVVVYGEPGNFYVHRLIHVQPNNGTTFYFFKPDHRSSVKRNISADKIMGKVIEVRGANRKLDFNSLFWKYANPFLATVLYVHWRSYSRDTLYWKYINTLFLIVHRMKPKRYSISLNVLKVICLANKMWLRLRPFKAINS